MDERTPLLPVFSGPRVNTRLYIATALFLSLSTCLVFLWVIPIKVQNALLDTTGFRLNNVLVQEWSTNGLSLLMNSSQLSPIPISARVDPFSMQLMLLTQPTGLNQTTSVWEKLALKTWTNDKYYYSKEEECASLSIPEIIASQELVFNTLVSMNNSSCLQSMIRYFSQLDKSGKLRLQGIPTVHLPFGKVSVPMMNYVLFDIETGSNDTVQIVYKNIRLEPIHPTIPSKMVYRGSIGANIHFTIPISVSAFPFDLDFSVLHQDKELVFGKIHLFQWNLGMNSNQTISFQTVYDNQEYLFDLISRYSDGEPLSLTIGKLKANYHSNKTKIQWLERVLIGLTLPIHLVA